MRRALFRFGTFSAPRGALNVVPQAFSGSATGSGLEHVADVARRAREAFLGERSLEPATAIFDAALATDGYSALEVGMMRINRANLQIMGGAAREDRVRSECEAMLRTAVADLEEADQGRDVRAARANGIQVLAQLLEAFAPQASDPVAQLREVAELYEDAHLSQLDILREMKQEGEQSLDVRVADLTQQGLDSLAAAAAYGAGRSKVRVPEQAARGPTGRPPFPPSSDERI